MAENYREIMDRILQTEVEAGRVPGASAMVLCREKELYCGAFGMADLEAGYEMKRDTIIRLFSMTKPVTAVSVMILAERGLLDLRDPVGRYLPEFWNQTVWTGEGEVAAARPALIWDLLNMTSGIPYPDDAHEPGRRIGSLFGELIGKRLSGETVTTADYVREIAKVPLCFQPGEKWMYGLSADVLGAVVERVTGMKFSEFLKKEIFDPLEMKDTAFYVPADKRKRFAQIYLGSDPQTGKPRASYDCHLGVYYGEDVAYESGGAGLVSTLDDYSHFASMLVNRGVYQGKRILGSRTVEYMTRNALSEAQKKGFSWESMIGYGYGCLMRTLENPALEGVVGNAGSFGWDGWTGNYVVMDPVDGLVVLYFIQRGDTPVLPVIRKLRTVTAAHLDELL